MRCCTISLGLHFTPLEGLSEVTMSAEMKEANSGFKALRKLAIPQSALVQNKQPPAKQPSELAAELILESVGEDLNREGLQRTPERFAKAIFEMTEGYRLTPEQVIGQGVFEAEGNGLVSVKKVEFHSMCEHHLLPFYGTASVAYYPNKKILGLSKVPRVVEMFAKRFQVQERLTREIAETIMKALDARAIVVQITADHMCMKMRGVEVQNSVTTTEYNLGLESLTTIEKERLFKSLD